LLKKDDKRSIVAEVPTGHGKSLLICALALHLSKLHAADGKKIYVVCQDSYLKYCLHKNYGPKIISVALPSTVSSDHSIIFC
jgi:hypothetical protein